MQWNAAVCDGIAVPDKARAVLRQAIARAPTLATPHVKLGDLYLDSYDFTAAAACYAAALEIDPHTDGVRARLVRCHNVRGRHAEALAVSDPASRDPVMLYERGEALRGRGRIDAADDAFRAALAQDPAHRRACMRICQSLRRAGHPADVVALCEDLHARGVSHAQLLLDWGRALALTGDTARAHALLLDPARIARVALPVPAGFATIAAFNAALAEEILTNPLVLSDFPIHEEANRGSQRVHALFAGKRPDLIRTLLDLLQAAIAAHRPARTGAFDPWHDARPASAHLHPWGLIQRGGEHETWHTHRGGWMSGVYYIAVPDSVTDAGAGPGCIEFGPPPAVEEALPGMIAPWRHAPRAGMLLLAPSHYHHRTIPTGADMHRISFAFDVVPDHPVIRA